MIQVLFVCLGNICRSPTAHGVFEHLVRSQDLSHKIAVDSAGTGAWHEGESPDTRSQQVAKKHGIDLSSQTARQVRDDDFDHYHYILAMDRNNLEALKASCPPEQMHKLQLLLDYGEFELADVPDPYYGGATGFDTVFELVNEACSNLLDHIKKSEQI